MLLITYNGNWADEMDISGFYTTTRELWDAHVARIRRHFEERGELSYYIGTNEEVIYESADDVLRDYTVREITDEQASTLLELFKGWRGSVSFGFTGPDVE